jgi:hypothetical protein
VSFQHKHDSQGGFLQIWGEGNATALDARVATRTFVRDNAIASSTPVLLDLCAMDDRGVGFDLEKLISYIDELQQTFKGKVAIIDARTGHTTICQLAAASVQHPEMVRAFMQEDAAKSWLLSTASTLRALRA